MSNTISFSFESLNTNKTPDKYGQQYLDDNEAKKARQLGIVWAESGQTKLKYEVAKQKYFYDLTYFNIADVAAQNKKMFTHPTPTAGIPDIKARWQDTSGSIFPYQQLKGK